jgi:hypothetical protein
MRVTNEEIIAIQIGGQTLCLDCVDLDEVEDKRQVIRAEDVDDDTLLFCDECGRRIQSAP